MDHLRDEVILDSIADGVFTVDSDWNITSFNRAAERITGVSRDQAIGQKCFDVLHADICQNACALRQTIRTGRQIIDLRVNILNGQGKIVPISISTAILTDQAGKVVGGVETFRDLSTLEMLRSQIQERYTCADIISKNHLVQKIFDILPDIAASDSTVLIEGPSGSGKELFARAIHNLSPRHDQPYIVVNCGALPDTLLESELFGYVKGAFTDAKTDKPGRFALAERGTIFLDEIGDISPAMQVKLLGVLQNRRFEPLGSTNTIQADVRVIAATNKTLSDQVAAGTFRQDIYYRLNVVKITLPALAQRREDIPLLVDHFIAKFRAVKSSDIERISPTALAVLMRHHFPGNVRELENAIEHAFVLCRGREIKPEHLPPEIVSSDSSAGSFSPAPLLQNPLQQAEADRIAQTLAKHQGNRRKTAAELGIHKSTLWRKMKRLGIPWQAA